MRFRILAAALSVLAAAASTPAAAQTFGAAFVEALCYNGAKMLSPLEEPQYNALSDHLASFTTTTPHVIYTFRMSNGVAQCESYSERQGRDGIVKICHAGPVARNQRQLTVSLPLSLAQCPTAQ